MNLAQKISDSIPQDVSPDFKEGVCHALAILSDSDMRSDDVLTYLMGYWLEMIILKNTAPGELKRYLPGSLKTQFSEHLCAETGCMRYKLSIQAADGRIFEVRRDIPTYQLRGF